MFSTVRDSGRGAGRVRVESRAAIAHPEGGDAQGDSAFSRQQVSLPSRRFCAFLDGPVYNICINTYFIAPPLGFGYHFVQLRVELNRPKFRVWEAFLSESNILSSFKCPGQCSVIMLDCSEVCISRDRQDGLATYRDAVG